MPEITKTPAMTQGSIARQPRRDRSINLTKHLMRAAVGTGMTGVPRLLADVFGEPVTVARRTYHIVHIGRDAPTLVSKRFENAAQALRLATVAEECGWVALIQHVELFPDEKNPPARCTECGAKWDDQTDAVTGMCGACCQRELDAMRAAGVVL